MCIHEIITEADLNRRGFLGSLGKAAAAEAIAFAAPEIAKAQSSADSEGSAQRVHRLAVANGHLAYVFDDGRKFPIVTYNSASGPAPRIPGPMWNNEKTKVIGGSIPLQLTDGTPASFFNNAIYIDLGK